MERNCCMVLVAKLIKRMETSFNKGSKVLPELTVGDRVWVQNRTTQNDPLGQDWHGHEEAA